MILADMLVVNDVLEELDIGHNYAVEIRDFFNVQSLILAQKGFAAAFLHNEHRRLNNWFYGRT